MTCGCSSRRSCATRRWWNMRQRSYSRRMVRRASRNSCTALRFPSCAALPSSCVPYYRERSRRLRSRTPAMSGASTRACSRCLAFLPSPICPRRTLCKRALPAGAHTMDIRMQRRSSTVASSSRTRRSIASRVCPRCSIHSSVSWTGL